MPPGSAGRHLGTANAPVYLNVVAIPPPSFRPLFRQDSFVSVPSFALIQLRYFAAAVEHGSMTAAARELMVSQSAVSIAIAQLE